MQQPPKHCAILKVTEVHTGVSEEYFEDASFCPERTCSTSFCRTGVDILNWNCNAERRERVPDPRELQQRRSASHNKQFIGIPNKVFGFKKKDFFKHVRSSNMSAVNFQRK
jgi:hypothetical protein